MQRGVRTPHHNRQHTHIVRRLVHRHHASTLLSVTHGLATDRGCASSRYKAITLRSTATIVTMHSAGATPDTDAKRSRLRRACQADVCARTLKQLCLCCTLIAACDACWRTEVHARCTRRVHTGRDQERGSLVGWTNTRLKGAPASARLGSRVLRMVGTHVPRLTGAPASPRLLIGSPRGTPGATPRALERLDPSRLGPCTAVATSSVPSSRSRRFGRH